MQCHTGGIVARLQNVYHYRAQVAAGSRYDSLIFRVTAGCGRTQSIVNNVDTICGLSAADAGHA